MAFREFRASFSVGEVPGLLQHFRHLAAAVVLRDGRSEDLRRRDVCHLLRLQPKILRRDIACTVCHSAPRHGRGASRFGAAPLHGADGETHTLYLTYCRNIRVRLADVLGFGSTTAHEERRDALPKRTTKIKPSRPGSSLLDQSLAFSHIP